MKTLHPADNAPPWTGIPSGGSVPTVVMEYEGVLRVTPPAGLTDPTWQATLNLLANPVQPLSVETNSTTAAGGSNYLRRWGYRNPTFGGDNVSFTSLVSAVGDVASHWRICHVAMTAELDAPALSDQGTVVSAQIPLNRTTVNASWLNQTNFPDAAHNGCLVVGNHLEIMDFNQNRPAVDVLSAKPLAYSGLAKHGVYQVLKLDPNVPWMEVAKAPFTINKNSAFNGAMVGGVQQGVIVQKTAPADPSQVGYDGWEPWPYYSSTSVIPQNRCSAPYITTTASSAMSGSVTPGVVQPMFGCTTFYNMSSAAALTVRVRWGVEYIPQLFSVLTPAQKAPAPLDELALETYGRICAVAPDAYPASYNDWDQLSGYLKRAYNIIRPALRFASSVPGPVGMVASGIGALGDLVAKESKERKPEVVPQKRDFVAVSARRVPKSAVGVKFKKR